jgi:hypothetical protein
MATGGQITIEFAANLARLQQDVGKATRMVEGFGANVKRALGTALAGFGAYSLVNTAKATLDNVEALNKMAQKAGIASEEMQGLSVVAKIADAEIETLTKGFKFLASNVVDAQQGSTDAALALRTLGASAADTETAHSQLMEKFLQVSDKVSQMQDGYVKTAYVTKVFGKAGMDLIPVLNEGRDALEGMIRKGREWGVVLDEETVGKIERFNDAMDEFSLRLQGAKNQVMAGMVDSLERIATAYDNLIPKVDIFNETGKLIGFVLRSVASSFMGVSTAIDLVSIKIELLKSNWDQLANKWNQFRKGPADSVTGLIANELGIKAELPTFGGPLVGEDWANEKSIETLRRHAEAMKELWGEGTAKTKRLDRSPAFTPPKASDIDKVQGVIDKLRIEDAQLGKTAREQAVYNTLREAGFKLDEKTGLFKGDAARIAQITELTESIVNQKQALEALNAVNQRAADVMNANQTEAAGWADQLEDLRDLANSGKITWDAYSIAVSKVNAEMAKMASAVDLVGIEKMKNVINALEIQNETPAVTIAKMKADALKEELVIRERILSAMPRLTAEQQAAWNSESEALDRLRGQLLEQEQIIMRYNDLWSGVRQGLKSYYDEAAAMADQVKKTVEDAFKGMEDALVQFVQNGKLDFRSLIDSIEADLIRLAVRQAITGPLSQGLGNAMSAGGGGFDLFSMFGGGSGMFFHKGGVVGRDGVPGRIPASYFRGAPRHHSGLAPDEVPAILQKGETVIPKGKGGGNTFINMNIMTPDAQSFRASQDQIMRRASRGMRRVNQ